MDKEFILAYGSRGNLQQGQGTGQQEEEAEKSHLNHKLLCWLELARVSIPAFPIALHEQF